jgi:microcystin-dependent protein
MAINFPDTPSNGQEFTSGATTWVYDGVKWALKTTTATTNDSMPVGSIMWFAGTATPTAWLPANGDAVSRTTYATLFAVIGTTYGVGDGSTTFNVPSVASTTGAYYIRYTTSIGTVTTTALSSAPVGTMIDWPVTSSYPTGWLRADGTNVSRVSYADLFSLISTTYGSGDGSTTFGLPNLPAAGSGSPVKIIKATLSGITEPSTVSHASSHAEGGSDVVSVTLNQVPNYQTYRNVIINGAMQVSQRAAVGAAQTGKTTGGYFTADRWLTAISTGTWTQSVEADAPAGSGLRNSLKMACTTATGALSASSAVIIEQRLEGQDVQRIRKGTSSAQQLTLSFWVKSNVTGTYIAELRDNDNTRFVSAAYTITSSGTWEQKTLTFPADTSGVLDNDNADSFRLLLWLAAGSNFTSGTLGTTWHTTAANRVVGQVNLGSADTNMWQVTGVQLEAGSVSTPFEFLPFGDELAKCQRYYWRSIGSNATSIGTGLSVSATNSYAHIVYPVTMRANPTTADFSSLVISDNATYDLAVTVLGITLVGSSFMNLGVTHNSGATTYRPAILKHNGASAFLGLSAEL